MYRKSYFCVCAGQQEEMYLKHLAQLLKKPNERVVTFNTTVGSAELLRRNYTEYDKAVLFDHDFNEVEPLAHTSQRRLYQAGYAN